MANTQKHGIVGLHRRGDTPNWELEQQLWKTLRLGLSPNEDCPCLNNFSLDSSKILIIISETAQEHYRVETLKGFQGGCRTISLRTVHPNCPNSACAISQEWLRVSNWNFHRMLNYIKRHYVRKGCINGVSTIS
jgi:hypothetical protein